MTVHDGEQEYKKLDSLDTLYVWWIGGVGAITTIFTAWAAISMDSRGLRAWAMLGGTTTLAAAFQLRRRRPNAGFVLVVSSVAVIPVAFIDESGTVPTVVAAVALLGGVMALVNPRAKAARRYLVLLWVTMSIALMAHHELSDPAGHRWDHSEPELIIGSLLLASAYALIYFHSLLRQRVSEYDEGLHRAMFDGGADAVLIIDESGTIVRANPAASEVFGAGDRPLVGQPISRLVSPQFRAKHQAHIESFMATDRRHVMTDRRVVEALRSWGEPFPVEMSITSFSVGGRRMAAAVVRDVTNRIRAEQEALAGLQKYQDLYQNVPIALYRTTGAGRIVEANRALVEMIGASSREEALDTAVTDLYVDVEQRDGILDHATDKSTEVEFEIRRLDGETIWVRDHTTARIDEGDVIINEGALEDVTHEVHAIEVLEQATAQQLLTIQSLTLSAGTAATFTDRVATNKPLHERLAGLAITVLENTQAIATNVERATGDPDTESPTGPENAPTTGRAV